MYESLLPFATSIGGGFFIGILLGYFLKKVIKVLIFVTGGLIGLLLYLEQQNIISIDMERVQVTSSLIFTSITSSFDNMTQIGGLTSLGTPLTASTTAGFTLGFMKA